MISIRKIGLIFCGLWLLSASTFPQTTAKSVANMPPNIVMIVSDDHGWRDYGFMGHPQIRTPNLDKLASQSLLFRRGYVPTALCSPSLVSIITGRYPHEHLVTGNDPPAPPGGKQGNWRNHPQYVADWNELRSFINRQPTLPRLLEQKGYVSLQTGKWWMGSPANGGFTEGMSHGDKDRGGRHGDVGLDVGRKTMQPITDFIVRARSQQKPFFIWYAPMLPHSPHNAPQRLIEKYRDKAPDPETAKYWASVEWFDETCGQLLDQIEGSNTIVVYVADNGWIQGSGDAVSIRSKRTPYDAGIRTPIMIRWPGKITPRASSRLASSLDIVPTLLAATGIEAPKGLPGVNLLNDTAVNARRTLYGASFTHDLVKLRDPSANVLTRWVIDGDWKLLLPTPGQTNEEQPQQTELYKLSADADERQNLADKEPSRVTALRRKLDAWWNPSHQKAQVKPNILILYADDWRHDTLGVAGNPVVKTPNLDQLAREGVRFTNSFVTTSICGVSRATLFTGQWMSRHGNPAFEMFKTPWSETYPGLLRANGYHVGHVGKWHNGKFLAENFDFGRSYAGKHYQKQPDGTTIHVTQKNENDALEFLKTRPAGKPFVLTLAFFATHAEDENPKQYLYQPQSETLYQDVTIPTPKTAGDEFFRRLPPFIANEKNEGRNRWHWRFDTPEKYQQYMKAYYRMATEVDSTVGKVLAELRAQGLDDNTLVIFTTDNGYFHGEHGLADKWYPYEESIRVPLIVRDPRMPKAKRGTTNDAFVLNVDLAPTILGFAGVAAPKMMQGTDFAPLYLSAKKQMWRQEFFYEHATIRNTDFIPSSQALVRRDAKYIYWPDFNAEELFDLKRDPREERNLAKDPAQVRRLANLRKRFAELKTQAK